MCIEKTYSFKAIFMAWLTIGICSCSTPGTETMTENGDSKTRSISFEEEVRLTNGRVITVNRTVIQRKICEGISCSWGRLRERVLFRDESGKQIVWEEQLTAFLVDKGPQGWMMVGRAGYASEQQMYNAQRNPYVVFVLEGNDWERVEFTNALIGRDTNMLIQVNQQSGESTKVTLESKRERNSDRYLPESVKRIAPDAFRKGG